MNNHIPTVIDLFSGPGGTGLGFKEAGFKILSAVELDEDAAQTYEVNLGTKPTVQDIRSLDPKHYREEIGIDQGELDVLVGCPPCQGFTRMRNSSGRNDKRNDLVLVYLQFILEFRPKFVLFENVPGLIRTEHGKLYYDALTKGLESVSYHFQKFLVNAADYGAPQQRRRIIVVAARDKVDMKFPSQMYGKPNSKNVIQGLLKPWRTVQNAISKYPPIGAGETHLTIPNHVTREIGSGVLNFIALVPKDGGSRTDVPRKYWLPCHLKHTGHKDVYGRLSWKSPSNVITSGCTNVSKGRFVHPEQDRGLSQREAAALQGFPDTYVFYGGLNSVSQQIGNAVPPPLAFAIGMQLKTEL